MIDMSAIQDKFTRLQEAYPTFLNDFVKAERRHLFSEEKLALRLFATSLREVMQDSSVGPIPPVLYIQKRWSLICRELTTPEDKFSDKFVRRIGQITKKLTELSKGREEPTLITNAELIFHDLSNPAVEKVLKDTWDEEAEDPLSSGTGVKYHFATYKLAMNHTKDMVVRILHGTYGERLKQNLRDCTKNPLLLDTNFKKMLFIDLYLQNLNPKLGCEWFSECDDQDIDAVCNALDKLRSDLKDNFSLSDSEIMALLMHKSAYLPGNFNKTFNAILQTCDYRRGNHNVILDSIRAYIAPSCLQLASIAAVLAPENPVHALEIACRIEDAAERLRCHWGVVNKALKLDLGLVQKLHEFLYSSNPETYLSCVRRVLERVCDLPLAIKILGETQSLPQYPAFVKAVVQKIAEKPLDDKAEAELLRLLFSLKELENRDECLDACFKSQTAPSVYSTLEKAYEACMKIVKAIKDPLELQLGLSSLFFWMLCRASPQQGQTPLLALDAALTDKEQRLHVFDRWVKVLKKSPTSLEKISAHLRVLEPFLKDENDKLYLFKTKVRLLMKDDPEGALELSESAPNERTRISLKRFVRSCDRPSKGVDDACI